MVLSLHVVLFEDFFRARLKHLHLQDGIDANVCLDILAKVMGNIHCSDERSRTPNNFAKAILVVSQLEEEIRKSMTSLVEMINYLKLLKPQGQDWKFLNKRTRWHLERLLALFYLSDSV